MKKSELSSIYLLFILQLLAATSLNLQNFTSNEDCKKICTVIKQDIVCGECKAQAGADEASLKNITNDQLAARVFCKDIFWKDVSTLYVESENITKIDNYTFDCLYKLGILKLNLLQLGSISINAFYGLVNVKVLDLSGCLYLTSSALTRGLLLRSNLPRLSTLVLRNMGSFKREGVEFTQTFIDALTLRNISEIDVSFARVRFEKGEAESLNLEKLCQHLKVLNLSGSDIDTTNIPMTPCNSLELVDFNGMEIFQNVRGEGSVVPIRGEMLRVDKSWMYFFCPASRLFLERLYFPHAIDIKESTLLVLCNNSFEEIHLSGYRFHVFELEMIFRPNKLKMLDLSDNEIERLSPKTFANLEHLEKLDLSKNKLENQKYLFRNNSKLVEIDLASNNITDFSSELLASNINLKRLDLSRNKITKLRLELPMFSDLEKINLQSNSIEYLDSWSRRQIDMLLDKQNKDRNKTAPNKSAFTIDLRNNPFSCKCHSLEFIQWFVHSPVFEGMRHYYFCTIDGQQVPMNHVAVDVAKQDCDKLKHLLISIILPVAALVLLIIMCIIVFRKYKQYKIKQMHSDVIRLIQKNKTGFPFLVFLSFASKDDVFVLSNVFQPLQEHLKTMTKTDQVLVAIGDLQFRLGRSIFWRSG